VHVRKVIHLDKNVDRGLALFDTFEEFRMLGVTCR
jgi:hypothetical protein